MNGSGVCQDLPGAVDSPWGSVVAVSFQPLTDHQLHDLADDQLIAYIRAGRDAGEREVAKRALWFLVDGHEADVRRRLRLRLPKDAPFDDLAHDVLVRAVGSAFDGRSIGQFRAWLNTIVDRAAVDYYRAQGRQPPQTALPSEHLGDDDVWTQEPGVESEAGAVELRLVKDEVMAEFNDVHRHVLELHVFGGLTAPEVCDRMDGVSEANVAQIASRFRKRLKERLDAGGGDTP